MAINYMVCVLNDITLGIWLCYMMIWNIDAGCVPEPEGEGPLAECERGYSKTGIISVCLRRYWAI